LCKRGPWAFKEKGKKGEKNGINGQHVQKKKGQLRSNAEKRDIKGGTLRGEVANYRRSYQKKVSRHRRKVQGQSLNETRIKSGKMSAPAGKRARP